MGFKATKNRIAIIIAVIVLVVVVLVGAIAVPEYLQNNNSPSPTPTPTPTTTSSPSPTPTSSPSPTPKVTNSPSPTATAAPTPTPTPAPTTTTVVDMYGRTVTVPTTINRVLCTSPIEEEFVYMLAPNKLVGLPFTYNGNPAYVPDQYANITVVGGWYGTSTGNIETFLAAKPDIILDGTDSTNDSLAAMQQQFGTVPVLGCNAGDYLTQYKPEITFIGNVLGVQTQAQNLNNYYQDAMNYVTSKSL